ncbi:MAG: phosphonate ABC transporter, permease protein PhnE [Propionibacterium sp.]|nr:phosphonate ABC transporter, permease protein PhnE [Propionibacterium sp.]
MGAFLFFSIRAVIDLRINIATMVDSADNAANFIRRTVPLEFPSFAELWEMTALTLSIVTVATLLAVIMSTVVALLAARPTSSSRAVRGTSRAFIVLMRAMPELVLTIIFTRLFGLGTVAGVLALALHSIGMVGKMVADAIEDADDGPRRALEASGAGWLQQVFGATLPGIFPAMIAHGLHRFDINLRASVVLGWVGVGGIGLELSTALSTMNYQRGMALAIVVLALCIVIEIISGFLRMKLLGRSEPTKYGFFWLLRKLRGRWSTARLDEAPSERLGRRTVPPWNGERITRFSYMALTVALILLAVLTLQIDWGRFFGGFLRIGNVAGQFLPPSSGGVMDVLLAELLVTLNIALAATLLGAILALPVGFLAARNVAPNKTVSQVFRVIIVVTRGIPELILAIVFIVISGMGPVAGTLALTIGAMGLLSKLVADSIEDTDVRVQQALAASGATRSQVFFGATLRQAAPAVVGHVFYQLDVNFRSATLLGIVGAGGIGFHLLNATRVLEFEVVTMILVMIIAVVLLLEAVAIMMRNILR